MGEQNKRLPPPDSWKASRTRGNELIIFDYRSPSLSGGPITKGAIAICNEEASKGNQQQRERFIRRGGTVRLSKAYPVMAGTVWQMRGLAGSRQWSDTTHLPLTIKCLPTNKFVKTSSTTSTTSANAADAQRRKQRGASPNGGDAIKSMSFTVNPANVGRVGNWMCPTTLRLRGRLDVKQHLDGYAGFRTHGWNNQPQGFELRGGGGRYFTSSYPVKWGTGGLSAGGDKAPRQDIAFRFNVYTSGQKIVKQERKSLRVICRNPDAGASGAAVQDMTGQ